MDPTSRSLWEQEIDSGNKAAKQGNYRQAEKFFASALSRAQQSLAEPQRLIDSLTQLANCYYEQGDYTKAIPLYQKLLTMQKHSMEVDRLEIVKTLDKLARVYRLQDQPADIAPLYQQALEIEEKLLGPDHPVVSDRLEKYAEILTRLNRAAEALNLSKRAAQAKKKALESRTQVTLASPSSESRTKQIVLIGHLLTRSGFLSFEEMNRQLKYAKTLGLPLGRVLVSGGYVTESHVQAALDMQSLIKDNIISMEDGLRALSLIAKDSLTVDEAIQQIGCRPNEIKTHKLGRLLVDSGLLNEEELRAALAKSSESKMMLGQVLVLSGKLSPIVVAEALKLQELARDGSLTHEHACLKLQEIASKES
ncbi:MAG: tetratricopeptide repeat protein [Candidatus Melainabacteria bacterium]|nr:tetratricopeptide repeat protein [Candidatus Melainabacteria bacterium]